MVLLADRELEILAALHDNWERLYRNELARLLWQEAQRRGRPDVKLAPAMRSATILALASAP